MPYLRRDLDRSPEEVFWFYGMGSLIVTADIHASKPVASTTLDQHDSTSPKLSRISEMSMQAGEPGTEDMISRTPSPPDSRPETPRATITSCPISLTTLIPPENYGAVEHGSIFRSGFPKSNNISFMETLRIRSIITLVEHDPKPEVAKFTAMFGINHVKVPIEKNKHGRSTTVDSLCEALLFIMNPTNHPVHIHCNMGKHRTGCVVACLRKCQQWPINEIVAEYNAYAGEKARQADIEIIKSFDPASVYEYAKSRECLNLWSSGKRQDSATDIWDLAACLPVHELSQLGKDEEVEGGYSSSHDVDLTMRRSTLVPESADTTMNNATVPVSDNIAKFAVHDVEYENQDTPIVEEEARPDVDRIKHRENSAVSHIVKSSPMVATTGSQRYL